MPIKNWLFSIIGMFGYHYFLFDAFSKAPAINVNLIQYLWPLFIVLATPIVTQFSLNWGHILGGVLGFTGVGVALAPSQSTFSDEHMLGYLEALIAALLWAFYTLSNKNNKQMSVSVVAGICFISGILSVGSFVLLNHDVNALLLDITDVLLIIALGLGPMGLAFYTWDYAVRNGDPRFIGSLCYFTPLLSSVLMVLIYKEIELGLSHFIALFLVSIGAGMGRLVEYLTNRR